jgi:UDP-N-acetylmuramoyl-L-alanyl-D-glutamate--2,6-diaminopimelate ligase
MANLEQFIEYLKPSAVFNFDDDIEITGITFNSKKVKSGDVFVCIKGEHTDGHNYVQNAVENGASAIIAMTSVEVSSVPVLMVEDTTIALAQAAAVLYDFPSEKINLLGITGTNGKTTVTHLIQNIFEKNNSKCGLIGTLGYRYSSTDDYIDKGHTTPQASDLQEALKDFLDKDIKNVVMEVSSHSIEQHRIAECNFKGAVLTNLTQDHLDYHITMENYFLAKSKLFSSLKSGSFAVINKDDSYAQRFIDLACEGVKILTYGINNKADVTAENIEFSVYGSKFTCTTPYGTRDVNLQMAGMFSVYNALAALSTGLAEGIDLDVCIEALESTPSVAGRFEVVFRTPLVIVDYAHTPDGLENVFKAARQVVPANGKLIGLFGCGGDRDATKRPQMGRIAEELCDKVIITSDNPRSEDPQQILTDILTGIKSLNQDKIIVEVDRRAAIESAIRISNDNDVIVLAGKGHENYQILKNETIHFDDREEAKIALNRILPLKK